jgi:YD repeat-containing protein
MTGKYFITAGKIMHPGIYIINPIMDAAGNTETSLLGPQDTFIARVNPSGSATTMMAYLGGASSDQANGIALDPKGNIYVGGTTQSVDFPIVPTAAATPGKTVYGGGGVPPVTTQFIFDGDRVIEERGSGVVSASFVLDGTRSHDDGVIQMQRNGQTYYYHTDDQGNVLALTTTGGTVAERYDYDDFGAVTFLTSDGVPTTATSSSVGNVYCWGGLRLDSETGLQCDDGGGYLETASGRSLARAQDDLQRTGSIVQLLTRNNPWSGSGSRYKNMVLKGQKILQNRMAGGGYWGETPEPDANNVVVGNFVGTVASSNSAVTAR